MKKFLSKKQKARICSITCGCMLGSIFYTNAIAVAAGNITDGAVIDSNISIIMDNSCFQGILSDDADKAVTVEKGSNSEINIETDNSIIVADGVYGLETRYDGIIDLSNASKVTIIGNYDSAIIGWGGRIIVGDDLYINAGEAHGGRIRRRLLRPGRI